MLDNFYVEEIIFESLIAHFPTTATVSCQIASRRLKPACDRNLRRLPTSIIEKLLTACELLGRWRGGCISSSVITRQCGWPRESTTFFESQRSMWSYSSSSSSSTSAITLIISIIWDVDWSCIPAFLALLAAIFSICLPRAWNSASGYSKCSFHSYTYCETLRKGTLHWRCTDQNRFQDEFMRKNFDHKIRKPWKVTQQKFCRSRIWICANTLITQIDFDKNANWFRQ